MLQRGIASRAQHERASQDIRTPRDRGSLVRALGRRGPVPARARRGDAVDDRHAAAQCHRLAAHRPCARHHAPGRAHPPRADARQGRACGWSAPTMPGSPPRWSSSATSKARASSAPRSGARRSSSTCGSGRRNRAARSPASCAASAPVATGRNERFTMDERLPARRHQDLRRTLQARPRSTATSAWSIGTPTSRPRSATSRSRRAMSRASSGPALSARGRQRRDPVATTRPETMLADMAVAVHPDDKRYKEADRQADQAADHRPADPDRRRRACRSRARQRRGQDHARAMTSTISRSASAPASSPPTCSTCSMRRRMSCRRRTG